MTSSFVFPKAGITPVQLGFISSRSSLGAFGYEVDPPAFPDTETDGTVFASMMEQEQQEIENHGGTSSIPDQSTVLSSMNDGRGRSSSSVSISSPLRSSL